MWGFATVNALTFVTQPTNTVAGQFISPPVQVKATDSSGAVLPFIAITISIGSNPSSGGTLSGTLTQTTDATGIATFNDLSIDRTGGYTLLASSANVFQRSLFFAVVDPVKPTFTGTQTGPNQWTYTLTFAPLVNYSIFPVATSNTNLTTITLTGLFGVTSAAGPTSTDFPSGGSPTDLNAINLNWSAAVLNGGTKVVYTHVGPGTGNFTNFRHAFGFTINASGAVNGTAPLATSGFSRDTTNQLPDGTFKLDITGTTDGPAPTASSMSVLATGVSTPPRSGGEALAANLATSNLFVKSLQDPAGSDLQLAQIAHDRTVTILGDFPSMVNSDASGIAVHPAGGIIVADEAGQRIALIGLSSPLTSSTLFNVPWKMNPSGNGTGQQRYAPILTQFGTGQTHLLLYFWDSTTSTLYSVDALASTTFTPLLALDQTTAAGMHFTTAGNHIVYDFNTAALLLTDGSTNTILEVNPSSGARTTLFSGLPGTPSAIALNAITNKVFVQIGNSIYVGPRSGGSLSLVQSGFTSLTDIVVGKATSGTGLSLFAVDKALNVVYEILIP